MLELASLLNDLHVLRPLWLLLVPAAVLLYVLLKRRRDARRSWQRLIAPHLLEHLVIGGGKGEVFRPEHLVPLIVALGGLALAGPTWIRERPPFADDQAALVVAIDASSTMNAVDVPPTRLERAKQKVRDLLARRPGAKTGLIAYAGSAHTVLPLTEDREILDMYLQAIDTAVMPEDGQRPSDAIQLGHDLLERQATPGSILILTDGVPPEDVEAVTRGASRTSSPVLILGIGTSRGGPIRTGNGTFATDAGGERRTASFDRAGLEALAGKANVWLTTVTVDDSDVRRIEAKASRDLAEIQASEENWRWKDLGYYLVFPLLLLGALWFRRGWTVRWTAGFLLAALWLTGGTAHAHESEWQDLWKTPDQQGRWHFERGEYEEAAAHFQDPMWRGVALHRAGQYAPAIESFALVDTPASFFNQGNAYARLERWDDAIRCYERVLARRPGDEGAKANLDLVRRLKKHEEESDEEEPAEGGDQLGADEVVEADPNDKKKRPETTEEGVGGAMDESMAEVWMRQVQTTPAAFLRGKFAIQRQQRDEPSARREEDDR